MSEKAENDSTSSTPSTEAASEETIIVNSASGRGDPTRAGPVVVVLKSGDRVRVLKNQNGWKQVVKDGITFWILAQQLSKPPTSQMREAKAPTVSAANPNRVKVPERQNKRTQSSAGCSCSSGRTCTGPRGGVYCLTTSGNKDYGR